LPAGCDRRPALQADRPLRINALRNRKYIREKTCPLWNHLDAVTFKLGVGPHRPASVEQRHMGLHQFLKDITPPLLVDALRKPVPAALPSWQHALAQAGQSYSSDLVNRFRVDRALLNGDQNETSGVLLLVAAMIGMPDLAITDFGGSAGDHAGPLLERFPKAQYVVVENPSFVAYASNKFAPVRFRTEIPEACDIFFTSCALQYVENPYEVVSKGLASASRACIFIRNSFAETEVVRVQESRLFNNGHGAIPPGYIDRTISYPHRTIVESRIVEIARRHNFELVGRLYEPMTAWPASRDTYGRQLVFLRTQVPFQPFAPKTTTATLGQD
jgi:putative methyltransferase (TIGR04325 family)